MSDEKRNKPGRGRHNIGISEETHRGVYSNKVIVAHSAEEFIFDFVADFPPAAQIVSRVITSPAHAKALLATLQDNVARYEQNYGPIPRRKNAPGTLPPTADA